MSRPDLETLTTTVNRRSSAYRANREAMLSLLADVDQLAHQAAEGGGPDYVERHRRRGKLPVRERISLLLDRDSYFLELSPLAATQTQFAVGAGMVTGIGTVAGGDCVIIGNDPTVRGGSINPYTSKKWQRALAIAAQNRLPVVQLVESGGGDLPTQAEGFVEGGRVFADMSHLSRAGVPTVAVVFGSATAGGAYIPAMSDYTILIREQSHVFLGGSALVKVATGEEADEEELGGADMHASVSGVADYLAHDERDALRTARSVLAHLDLPGRQLPTWPDDPPVHDPEDLLGIVPADVRIPYDVREVVARIADGSRFGEFKPRYGAGLVTGWCAVHGYRVGVVANNGVLMSEESEKAAHFIGLCNQISAPILFLQNTTGYVVGTSYERRGIVKDGAKMVRAVSNSTVPHVTVMMGASYGAGNYGMSGRAYSPRFVFSWPNHRIGIMGAEQMAGVLSLSRRRAYADSGKTFDEDQDAAMRHAVTEQLERESRALFATGRLWDDGIVDPRQTRTVLGIALGACHYAPVRGTTDFGPVRM